jgi:hypothetical protein
MLTGGIDSDQFRLTAERNNPLRKRTAGAYPTLGQLGRSGIMTDEESGTDRSDTSTQAHKQLP